MTKTTDKPLSGPQLAAKVLEDAGRPLHRKLIAERTVAADRARPKAQRSYTGKTPEQTIAAALEVSNKAGGTFVKVSPGIFGLREWTAAKLRKTPELPEGFKPRGNGNGSPAPAKSEAPKRTRRGPAPDGVDPQVAAHSTVVSEGKGKTAAARRKAKASRPAPKATKRAGASTLREALSGK